MNIDSTSAAGIVLRELTWCVRVLTTVQLQRIFDAHHEASRSIRPLLRRLSAERLVKLNRTAAVFYEANEPIALWKPGDAAPDFDALAWQLEKRWRIVTTRRITICWATSRAARLFGGLATFGRRASQLEHDLGTASVAVRLHEIQPDLAVEWVSEDILRRDFAPSCPSLKKIPDGAIVRRGRVIRVSEFGGQYSAARLRRFHLHFKKHRIPYDLW